MTSRTPTATDALADAYLDAYAELNPIDATGMGIETHDDRLPSFTPDWWQSVSDLRRRTLTELDGVQAQDRTDRLTVAALRESLQAAEAVRDIGGEVASLNVIDSPLQSVRDVFDITPASTESDWSVIARRLHQVPQAIDGYVESLRSAASRGNVVPRRQIEAGIRQSGDNVGPQGFFARFAAGAAPDDGRELPRSVRDELEAGAHAASDAYQRLAAFLAEELPPQAGARDAVGREHYPVYARAFLGAQLDIEETYAWGQAELARITAEMSVTADRIKPGATVAEAVGYLDQSADHRLTGTAALQAWMQETSDAAVAALADTHFDIPQPIRRLECRIAPTQQGGIYYTGPSEDLETRPGRMWWSVPKGVTEFSTWRERTTVYHEGVPGHHLQVAQTAFRREILNRWRRIGSWVSGHGEGWALYAERLMADLGFLEDPADYLGMLDGQSLRAARVVLDIGVHCELPAPAEVGGGAWTYDKALRFLRSHVLMNEGFVLFELDRYLGWPGQAPSYKIGERAWLQLRADVQAREGDAFDLKAFHRRALDLGSVGLDVLRAALLDEI